jgi:hypothetical protein
MLEINTSKDGRMRFPVKLRTEVYRYLIDKIKKLKPKLQIGLCLEEADVFNALDMKDSIGRCNCVL